jgi:pyruvate-formate lyase-activating enzyme
VRAPEATSGGDHGRSAQRADGWVDALVRAAERVGIAVQQASARDGILTLEVRRAEGGGAVAVDVLPRAPRERYHLATARFGLRHHGRGAPAKEQQDALEALAKAIRSEEAGWPATLALHGGAGDTGAPAPAPFTVERSASVAGGAVWTELLVRLTARCNQRCPFCSGPPEHPDADPARVRAWLDEEVPRHPNPTVTLTGGEPGLWPGLPDLVGHLLARPDVVEVRVQTNAVPFARPERASAFPAVPRLRFFVSFHAARAELYDLCTGTHGQLEPAVAGIRNLLASGHALTLNVVANRHNADHLEDWVSSAAGLFAGPNRPRLHFSITMCPERRPAAPDWLVRYEDLAPRLASAARRAREVGLACEPLLASSHAAIPPCLLPESERARGRRGGGAEAVPVHRPDEAGVDDATRAWVKAEGCLRCSEAGHCLGVPRSYAARFGLAALRPLP